MGESRPARLTSGTVSGVVAGVGVMLFEVGVGTDIDGTDFAKQVGSRVRNDASLEGVLLLIALLVSSWLLSF